MKKTCLALLLLSLGACEPTFANRGNILDPETLSQIKPGETTREEVATKVGTPTAVSTFDEKTWYYVGRQTEQYSFLNPTVVKQQAIEVDFDDKGIVTAAKTLDLSKAQDVAAVDRATPTFGQEYTIWKELLGDFAHPKPDLNSKNSQGPGT